MQKDLAGLMIAIACWIFFFLLTMILLCRSSNCRKCRDSEADQARIVNVYYIGSFDNEESQSESDTVRIPEDLPPTYNEVVHFNNSRSPKIQFQKRYSF